MEKNKKKQTFENSIKKLEDIVEKLESGEIDLEESVSLYEEGMKLKIFCQERLKEVELKIKTIKLENNKISKEELKEG